VATVTQTAMETVLLMGRLLAVAAVDGAAASFSFPYGGISFRLP